MGSGCAFAATASDEFGIVDPLLGPLADNGGPTLTHALLPGSPAIDAGNPAAAGSGGSACESGDQRGAIRPGGSTCDIGAFELTLGSDLSITKVALKDTSYIGDELSYAITVTNNGPDEAGDVVVTDYLPGDVAFISASVDCVGTTTISCFVGGLPFGSSTQIIITVRPGQAGLLNNTATVSAIDDRDPGNNTAAAVVPIPSLTAWALIAMAGLVALVHAWRMGYLGGMTRRVRV